MEKDKFSLKLLVKFLVAAEKVGSASPCLSSESPASEGRPFYWRMGKAACAQSKASLSQIQMAFLGKWRMPKEERSKKGQTLRHKALNFPRKNQVH